MKKALIFLLAILLLSSTFTALAQSVPYRTKLAKGTPIYEGPGEDYGYAEDVRVNGVYTIVEEAVGVNGYLWGKLKSGAGWVRLSDKPVVNTNGAVPYTTKLPAWSSIFAGPGYDYVYRKLVGLDGVYTIVEEIFDDEGNRWGRLKSGAGWVDLTYVECASSLPVILSFADNALLESGEFVFHQADFSPYATKIAVRVNCMIENVSFSSLTLGEVFWETDEVLFSSSYLFSDMPLVIEVAFPGDMTTFSLDFTDEYGIEHHYLISISGRNGSLYAQPYVK